MNSQALFNSLGLLVLYGVNFLTLPLFSRAMGSEGWGVFSLYTTWAQIATAVIGLQVAATIPIAQVNRPADELEGYASSALTLVTVVASLALPIAYVYRDPLGLALGIPASAAVMVIGQGYFAAAVGILSQVLVNRLEAFRGFLYSMALTLTTTALSAALMFGPMQSEPYLGRIYGAFLGYAGIGLLVVASIYVSGRRLFDRSAWRFCLPIALPLILHGLSAIVLAQVGKILLQQVSGDLALVGYFGMAVTCASLLQALMLALNNTWVPIFYRMLGSEETAPAEIVTRAKNYLFLITTISISLNLASPEVVLLFAGSEFEAAVPLMPYTIGAVFLAFLYLFPANYQLYLQNSRYVSLGTVGATAVSVGVGIPLVQVWGATGAAIGMVVAYAVLFLFHSAIARFRTEGYPFSLALFVWPITAYAGGCVVLLLAQDVWTVRWALVIAVSLILLRRVVRQRAVF